MAKFIVGVLVGLFLGATTSAHGAGASRSDVLSDQTLTKDGENVCSGPNATQACGRDSGFHSWRASRSR
jgi:hypothetical protein